MNNDEKVHEDLKALANGINFTIATMNQGVPLDFMLILVRPIDHDHVTLNTITGITDPEKIRQIGQHLVDMANAHGNPSGLDADNDADIQGHA